MDFRAFVSKAPHLTIPRQRILVYGGKLLFSNAAAKISKAISQKRHDGFSFLNDGNLDKCLSKKKIHLTTPALWLSGPHWAKCMTNSYPRRSPSKLHVKTTALIRRRHVSVPRSRNFSDCLMIFYLCKSSNKWANSAQRKFISRGRPIFDWSLLKGLKVVKKLI